MRQSYLQYKNKFQQVKPSDHDDGNDQIEQQQYEKQDQYEYDFPQPNPIYKCQIQPLLLKDTYKKVHTYLFDFDLILGKGSFSIVYKGINLITRILYNKSIIDTPVAIKVIQTSLLSSEQKLKQLLMNEIDILMKIQQNYHENIIKCYEVLSSKKNSYIVMEMCVYELGMLGEWWRGKQEENKQIMKKGNAWVGKVNGKIQENSVIKKQQMKIFDRSFKSISSTKSVQFTQQLPQHEDHHHQFLLPSHSPHHSFKQHKYEIFLSQIFSGIQHLSHHNIIHRDIKLSNIFISLHSTSHEPICKIGDFGFAIRLPVNSQSLTDTCCIGSPLYMSPQSYLYNEYSLKSDVWSFGILIFQLIYGYPPNYDCPSHEVLKEKIKEEINFQKYKLIQNISDQLEEMLKGCLQVDVNRRWTVKEVKQSRFMRKIINKYGNMKKNNMIKQNKTNFYTKIQNQQNYDNALNNNININNTITKSTKFYYTSNTNQNNSQCQDKQYSKFSLNNINNNNIKNNAAQFSINNSFNQFNRPFSSPINLKTQPILTNQNNSKIQKYKDSDKLQKYLRLLKGNNENNYNSINNHNSHNNNNNNFNSYNNNNNFNSHNNNNNNQTNPIQIAIKSPLSIISNNQENKRPNSVNYSYLHNEKYIKTFNNTIQNNSSNMSNTVHHDDNKLTSFEYFNHNQYKNKDKYGNLQDQEKYINKLCQFQLNHKKNLLSIQQYHNDHNNQDNVMQSTIFTNRSFIRKQLSTFSPRHNNNNMKQMDKQCKNNMKQNYNSFIDNMNKNKQFSSLSNDLNKYTNTIKKHEIIKPSIIITQFQRQNGVDSQIHQNEHNYPIMKNNIDNYNNQYESKSLVIQQNQYHTKKQQIYCNGSQLYNHFKAKQSKQSKQFKQSKQQKNDIILQKKQRYSTKITNKLNDQYDYYNKSSYFKGKLQLMSNKFPININNKTKLQQNVHKDKQTKINTINNSNVNDSKINKLQKKSLMNFHVSNNFNGNNDNNSKISRYSFNLNNKNIDVNINQKQKQQKIRRSYINMTSTKINNNKSTININNHDNYSNESSASFMIPDQSLHPKSLLITKNPHSTVTNPLQQLNFSFNFNNYQYFQTVQIYCQLIHFSRLLYKLSFVTNKNQYCVVLLEYSILILKEMEKVKIENFHHDINTNGEKNHVLMMNLYNVYEKQCYNGSKNRNTQFGQRDKFNVNVNDNFKKIEIVLKSYINKYTLRKQALLRLVQCNLLFQNINNRIKAKQLKKSAHLNNNNLNNNKINNNNNLNNNNLNNNSLKSNKNNNNFNKNNTCNNKTNHDNINNNNNKNHHACPHQTFQRLQLTLQHISQEQCILFPPSHLTEQKHSTLLSLSKIYLQCLAICVSNDKSFRNFILYIKSNVMKCQIVKKLVVDTEIEGIKNQNKENDSMRNNKNKSQEMFQIINLIYKQNKCMVGYVMEVLQSRNKHNIVNSNSNHNHNSSNHNGNYINMTNMTNMNNMSNISSNDNIHISNNKSSIYQSNSNHISINNSININKSNIYPNNFLDSTTTNKINLNMNNNNSGQYNYNINNINNINNVNKKTETKDSRIDIDLQLCNEEEMK